MTHSIFLLALPLETLKSFCTFLGFIANGADASYQRCSIYGHELFEKVISHLLRQDKFPQTSKLTQI